MPYKFKVKIIINNYLLSLNKARHKTYSFRTPVNRNCTRNCATNRRRTDILKFTHDEGLLTSHFGVFCCLFVGFFSVCVGFFCVCVSPPIKEDQQLCPCRCACFLSEEGTFFLGNLSEKLFLLSEIPQEACVCNLEIIVKFLEKLQMFGEKGELKEKGKKPK